jgi:hypothetical protein
MNETLSPELQTKVMTVIGQRRARTQAIAFAILWPTSFLFLMFVLGLGGVVDLIVSSILGGVLSKVVVKSRRDVIIQQALSANGVSREIFDPSKYIVD